MCNLFGKNYKFGYNISMMYDVVIVGGGPAGLSAGIFTCRAGLNTILLEGKFIGGQTALSYEIANYPGFEKISGMELTENMLKQAEGVGLNIEYENVISVKANKTCFSIKTKSKIYKAKKVILACGSVAKKLGLENQDRFIGKGISYCASCDGGFFKNKTVAVVGGGNSAVEYVNYLSRIAKKIYLIVRKDCLKAGDYEQEKLSKLKNVKILFNTNITKLYGDEVLTGVQINTNNKTSKLKIDGLFVAIGYKPELSFLNIEVEKDSFGYIIVDKNQQTSVKNLYACGDIVSKDFKQVISACSDGARAGNSCIGG